MQNLQNPDVHIDVADFPDSTNVATEHRATKLTKLTYVPDYAQI